jgi:hypothetical protein
MVNIGLCVPALSAAAADWLRDPGNPMWASNALCFAAFALVAVPFSIVLGGRVARRKRTAGPAYL